MVNLKSQNLKINVDELREAGEIRRTVESYLCEAIAENVLRQQFKLSYRAYIAGNDIIVQGDIDGDITIECCRCLEQFTMPVRDKILKVYQDTEEVIDLEDEIRQLLILVLPQKPLCRESCAGICPTCGKNLNTGACKCDTDKKDKDTTDSRWGKLKDLLK